MRRRLARLTSTSMRAMSSSRPTSAGAASRMITVDERDAQVTGLLQLGGHDPRQPTHEQQHQHQDGHQAARLDRPRPTAAASVARRRARLRGERPRRSVSERGAATQRSTALSSAHAEMRMASSASTPVTRRGDDRQHIEAGRRARRVQLVAEQDAQQDRAGDGQDGQRQQHQAAAGAEAHDAQQPQDRIGRHDRRRPCPRRRPHRGRCPCASRATTRRAAHQVRLRRGRGPARPRLPRPARMPATAPGPARWGASWRSGPGPSAPRS